MRNVTVGVLAGLTAFCLWVAWTIPWDLGDDAYITLNYAQDLAEGRGFVYNHPPASLGTTTPLFTFILAACHRVLPFVRLDGVAVLFSALCWAALPWMLVCFRVLWRLTLVEALVTGAVLVFFGNYFGLGMEAYLFGALLMGTCTLVLAGRYAMAGAAIGLLFLTRGEGILLAGLVPLWLLAWARGPARARGAAIAQPIGWMVIGGALVVVPWIIYAMLTFGGILPDTLAAKLAQTAAGAPRFGPMLLARLAAWGSYLPGVPWLTWIYHAVALAGLWRIVRARHPFLLPIGWALVYGSAYAWLDVPYYWWYELPVYQAWLLCIGMGLAPVVSQSFEAIPLGRRFVPAVAALGLLLCMALQTGTWAWHFAGYKKAVTYGAACDWLAAHAPPEAAIGSTEVGYIGYFLPNPIVDFLGLTTPRNIAAVATGDLGAAIWDSRPEFIVALDHDPGWQGVYASPRFTAAYEEAVVFPAPAPWERCLIYQRRADAGW